MATLFTNEEIQFIQDNYQSHSDEYIAEVLGRTERSIVHKRTRLGLLRFYQEPCADLRGEEWKRIPGTTDLDISNKGRLRSSKGIRKSFLDKKGYARVSIRIDGELSTKKVHRLVAEAFIPNTHDKPEVNHKDRNRSNNAVYNLEWSTRQENIDHKYN